MPTSVCPLGRLEPPLTARGQGKGMRRLAGGPWASTANYHRAERCLCHPSGPGNTFCRQAALGYLAARVTRAKGGGSRWAVPKSSRDGMGITTSRQAPRPPPPSLPHCGLRHFVLSALSPRSAHSGPGFEPVQPRILCPARCPHWSPMMHGEPLAPMVAQLLGPRVEWHLQTRQSTGPNTEEKGSADATTIGERERKQYRNGTFGNWEIRTNFVRISHKLLYSHTCPSHSFVRNSFEIRTNFVRISSNWSKNQANKHNCTGIFLACWAQFY